MKAITSVNASTDSNWTAEKPMVQILKFLIVGVSNTCLSLAVYSGMMHILPAVPAMAALSQIASYSSGMILSYTLNNFWVFQGDRGPTKALPSFMVSQLALMALSALAMAVATRFFHTQPELIWLSVMALITLINFTLLRKLVFRPN